MAVQSDQERLIELVKDMTGGAWDESQYDPDRETITLEFDQAPAVRMEVDDGSLAVYAEVGTCPVNPQVRIDFLAYVLHLNRPGILPEPHRLCIFDDQIAVSFVTGLDSVQPAPFGERVGQFARLAMALAEDLTRWLTEREATDAEDGLAEPEEFELAAPSPASVPSASSGAFMASPPSWLKA